MATIPFTGTARPFTADAIARAASAIGCDIAAVEAVIEVESKGGFLPDKRPKILFERHVFSRLTKGAHDAAHPDISSSQRGGYRGGAKEYERLDRACALNRAAAIQSASWGAFQIMGGNFAAAGFADPEKFCSAMCQAEDDQLAAFVSFVKASRLDDELCRRDWVGFARGYNGPDYRANRYDEKLAAQYLVRSLPRPRTDPRRDGPIARTLKMGDVGEDVARLQAALGLRPDGDFGLATKAALIGFQTKQKLAADGIAGSRTVAALQARR